MGSDLPSGSGDNVTGKQTGAVLINFLGGRFVLRPFSPGTI